MEKKEPTIISVSIDKLSIMGDFRHGGRKKFQEMILEQNSDITIDRSQSSEKQSGWMLNRTVYWESYGEKSNRRNFRIEFNPNKMTSDQKTYVQLRIMTLLKRVGLTRIDIAIDFDEPLSGYQFIELENPRKQNYWVGKTHKLETLYIGASSSDNQMRIYDKFKERKDKDNLTKEELELMEKYPNWHRVEIQLRDDQADFFYEQNIFRGVEMVLPSYKQIKKQSDRALAKLLIDDPDEWAHIKKSSRREQMKQLIVEHADFNLMPILKKHYLKELPRLLKEVRDYTMNSEVIHGIYHYGTTLENIDTDLIQKQLEESIL